MLAAAAARRPTSSGVRQGQRQILASLNSLLARRRTWQRGPPVGSGNVPAGVKTDDGVQIWMGWGPVGAAGTGPGTGNGPAAMEDVAGGRADHEAPDGVPAPGGTAGAAGQVTKTINIQLAFGYSRHRAAKTK